MKFIEWLAGKKTYILVFLMALFNLCIGMGWITLSLQQMAAIDAFLASLGLGTLRSSVKAVENKVDTQ